MRPIKIHKLWNKARFKKKNAVERIKGGVEYMDVLVHVCVWICQVFMKKKGETSKEHKSDKCCVSPSPPLFISMCRLYFLSSFNIPSSLYIVDTSVYFPTL